MALRALSIHWSDFTFHGDGTWTQGFDFVTTGPGLKATFRDVSITLSDNDSAAQIKSKVAQSCRDRVAVEWNETIEQNQVIFPDGTRG